MVSHPHYSYPNSILEILEILEITKNLVFSKIFIYFAIADRLEAPATGQREGSRHNEKRLSALILDHLKFSQNFYSCQGLDNDRCPWICNINIGQIFVRSIRLYVPVAYTSVGLLRCRPT